LPIGTDVAGGLTDVEDMAMRSGSLYLLDAKRKSVFVISREGKLERIIPLTLSDPRSSKKWKPAHLAVDKSGVIYVSDPRAYAIYKFDGEGRQLAELGGKGKEPGQFGKIADIAVDGRGALYALLEDRKTVSVFDSSGGFRMEIPLEVGNDVALKKVEALAVDSFGALYVYDDYYRTVFKFMQ
jgi:DNA-binding beta-propeller fold protein YncE